MHLKKAGIMNLTSDKGKELNETKGHFYNTEGHTSQ